MSTTHFFAVLDAFTGCEKRLWLSSCTSVCPHGISRLVMLGFYPNVTLGIFIKVWRENSSLVEKKKGRKISGTVREDEGTCVICL